MGSWIVRSVCLRFSVLPSLVLSSPFSSFGVFSIRLALRVTSQNRIFANGVNRQFPAPDFNRLVVLLPRRTARHGLAESGGSRAASFPLEPAFRLQKAAAKP